MSVFDSFAATSLAPFLSGGLGEPGNVTAKGGQAKPVTIIVHRDQLQPRGADKSQRLEYDLAVQISMAEYPGGKPNVGGDIVEVMVRKGDTTLTRKTVTKIIGQVGSMWFLGLD